MKKIIVALLITCVTTLAMAGEQAIKKSLEKHLLRSGESIKSLHKLSKSNIYEVVVSGQIFYTDSTGRYLMFGTLVDLPAERNLTRERTEIMGRISWNELPLDKAIKYVKGNGTHELAIFEDPNCGFCKKLETEFNELTDVTIYIFPVEFLGEKSNEINKNVICSKDPKTSWQEWMLQNKKPEKIECDYKNDDLMKFVKNKMMTGTPTIYRKDGHRVSGFLKAEDLKKFMIATQKNIRLSE